MPQNYYLILGVAQDATLDDVKNAYRRLAKEFHPDRSGENAAPFLAIQEAYSVLSDPVRRRIFDRSLQQDVENKESRRFVPKHAFTRFGAEPLTVAGGRQDIRDASLARSFHSFRPSSEALFYRLFSNFSSATRPKAEKLENLNVVITLTPEQAFNGGHVRLKIPAQLRCPNCAGIGSTGWGLCWRCHGSGVYSGEAPVIIKYPAGISDNYIKQLRLDRYGIHNFYLTVHFRVSETI